jgi:hypothetical protein
MQTTTSANINSAAYRLDARRQQPTCDRCEQRPAATRLLTQQGKRCISENVCKTCVEAHRALGEG